MPWVFNPFTGKLDQTAAAGGGSQVNSDWNSTSGVSQILNKPTIPAAQVNSDWSATNGVSQILNKPSLSAVATSGSVSDLSTGTLDDARLSSNVSLDNQNNNFTVGQSIAAQANTSALTASYSVTGANTTPLLDLSGTWNTTGVARGILLNVTDTASASGSLLADFQTNGSSAFSIQKPSATSLAGGFSFTPGTNTGTFSFVSGSTSAVAFLRGTTEIFRARGDSITTFNFGSAFAVGWNGDTYLNRDAANILAQRNGTNPQAFRLYNTRTDASNFEMGFLRWNSNVLEIGTTAGGTGTANRSMRLLIGTQGTGVVFSPSGSGVDINARSFTTGGNMVLVGSNISGLATCNYATGAADPTTTSLTNGNWQVYRNTTSGQIRLWANNNGTLVSVALA